MKQRWHTSSRSMKGITAALVLAWMPLLSLAKAGIEPSVGSVGDSYDNALSESINGLYKTELVHRQGPWPYMQDLEMATPRWVDWLFNRTSGVKPFARQTVGPEASWYRLGRRRSISVATGCRTRETGYRERDCFRGRQKPPHDGLRRMAFLCSTRSIRRNCIQS